MLCHCGSRPAMGPLCTKHAQRLIHIIRETPSILRELDVTITKLDQQGNQGSGGEGRALVFNIRASDARQELTRAICAMAAASIRSGYVPRLGNRAPLGTRAAEDALGGFRGLVKRDDILDLEDRLVAAFQDALRAIDRAEERITYGSCHCGTEISAPKTRDTAKCRTCGQLYNVAELRAFRYVAAQDALGDYVGTLSELHTVLRAAGKPVTLRQLKHLTERKTEPLVAIGQRAGVHVYRFQDALDRLPQK